MDRWTPEGALERIEKYKVTYSHMVPTMFNLFACSGYPVYRTVSGPSNLLPWRSRPARAGSVAGVFRLVIFYVRFEHELRDPRIGVGVGMALEPSEAPV